MAIEKVVNFASFSPRYGSYDIPLTEDNAVSLRLNPPVAQKNARESAGEQEDLTVSSLPQKEEAEVTGDVQISFSEQGSILSGKHGMGYASGAMKKAISGMEQDTMLHEYQYFVGNKNGQIMVNFLMIRRPPRSTQRSG